MKKYFSLFRMKFINGLQYRAAAAAGVATQFAWGIMEILLFAAFYRADPGAFPMTFPRTACYIWLQQAFLAMYMVWFFDNGIFDSITDGGVAYELCRPMELYRMWFVRNVADRLSRAVLRCMPILLVALLLPAPYRLILPPDPVLFALFLLSMLLAFMLVVAFCMLVYISAFYTVSSLGVRIIAASVSELLTGAVVPIPFFPDPVREIAQALPFAYMQNIPLRIYSGDISLAGSGEHSALLSIGMQLLWLAALVIAGRLWMGRALKKVVVQGG